jgi:hypothetical protein
MGDGALVARMVRQGQIVGVPRVKATSRADESSVTVGLRYPEGADHLEGGKQDPAQPSWQQVERIVPWFRRRPDLLERIVPSIRAEDPSCRHGMVYRLWPMFWAYRIHEYRYPGEGGPTYSELVRRVFAYATPELVELWETGKTAVENERMGTANLEYFD